ncbi:MAG: NAD-dependent succinate-semialdehyde dehydrogenase [Bdellovibrionales bacterium]
MKMTKFFTINPATGKNIKEYSVFTDSQVNHCVEKSYIAHQEWRKIPLMERATALMRLAKILRANAQKLSELMAEEMGKPLTQGLQEIEKCAACLEHYAKEGPAYIQNQMITTEARKSFISYQPLGPILAIMPWNFPFWQVIRCLAPQILVGNSFLLKHAQIATGCALEIEKLCHEAQFPDGLMQTLVIDGPHAEELIAHPLIRGVTLTGSTGAGKKVAAAAGKHLKKVVLELGGSDAYIILADCDLEKSVDACVASRLINSGQSCIAAKRFLVEESIADEFEKLFVQKMKGKLMGSPLEKQIEIGPQARSDLRNELHQQVTKSIQAGAKLLLGGVIPKGDGFYYSPTVLTNVRPGQPAFDEELFGPVAAITRVKNLEEAITLANQSEFGLGGAIFTKNTELAEQVATEELEVGSAFVNTFVRSDSRLPFGGVKNSGIGRELGVQGLHEFTNMKTVYIA